MKQLTTNKIILALLGLVVFAFNAVGNPISITWSGRMTEANGRPVSGPVEIEVKFFESDTGGDELPVGPFAYSVPLDEGVFEIDITMSDADFQTVFPQVGKDAWIQITDVTHQRTYTRQTFSPVPYALKVPVDAETLKFDANGKLTTSSIRLRSQGSNATLMLEAADATPANTRYTFPATPSPGQFLSVDATGLMSWETPGGGGDMLKSENLYGLADVSSARTNLGLGDSATMDVGTSSGSVAAGDHSHSAATTTTAGFMSAGDKVKIDGIDAGAQPTSQATVAAAGAVMDSDFADGKILVGTGTPGSYTQITDNSSNWDTGFADRLKWDGAQVGDGSGDAQTAARTALGLGDAATKTVGVAAGNVVELETGGKLPAVDGSQLTNLAGGGISTCPTGFTMIGTAGRRGAYCIDTDERAAAAWITAKTTCDGLSFTEGHATMCNHNEWMKACNAGTANGMTGAYEWVAEFARVNYAILAGFSCSTMNETGIANANAYRCCLR